MALTDDAIAKIKEMIATGRLGPGDRLPREPELAAQLGVSRNSLREAVRALTLVRVLSTRQGDGTYVTSLEPRLLLESVSLVTDLLGDETVRELYEVRRLLEPAATALAAVRIDAAAMERVELALSRLDAAATVEEAITADVAFHQAIVEGAGNALLASLIQHLAGSAVRARTWHALLDDETHSRARQGHHAIAEALRARDPDEARAATLVHLTAGERWSHAQHAAAEA